MSETIDMAKPNQKSEGDAVGIGKIFGKKIHITGYHETRGKPTAWTQKSDIDNDGMTSYYLIDTEEKFKLPNKEGKTVEIQSFFITNAIVQQIKRVPNYQEQLEKGNKLGPAKVGQKMSTKTNKNYWVLIFPNEEGF